LPQRSVEPKPSQAAPEPFALAPAQLGVWYAQLLERDVPINVAQYVDVRGELVAALLQEVSDEAAREYESVLVRLGESGGVPHRYVDFGLSVDIPLIDLRDQADPVPAALAQRLRALTGARLHNLYGPTEAAVDVTFHEVTDTDTLSVPIGAPVFNTRLYVLDSRLRPVPVGAPGELYLSGVQLARGYVARPELTAARFLADPFGGRAARAGGRMYRTGDLVRWTPHGELEYLGRTDFQVKLRGLRIELGEIEAVLGRVDAVDRAGVVLRDDAGVGEQLVAYVVEAEPGAVRMDRLRAEAAEALPGYMVPAAYVVLDILPVNASRKLDRRALPAPSRASTGYTAPATAVELAVARVFAEVLGNKLVGRDDDFFALGGNSLVATQVAARLSADLNCPLGVRDVFAACTVAELAALVERAGGSGGASLVAQLRARPRPPLVPLSPAQQRIWFRNRFDRFGASYNMPFVVRLPGAVDVTALRQALEDVVIRHEALRTIFPALLPGDSAGSAARQIVLSVAEVAGAPEAIGAAEDLAAFGHAELPFEQVVAALDPPRSQARHPLFQVLLAFDNAEPIAFELPELSVATSTLDTGVTKLDLQLTVTENSAGAGLGEGSAPAGVPAEFGYATDLFDEVTIAGYARALIRFLWAATADPGLALGDLPLLDHAEQARALAAGQAEAGARDPAETLLTAFEAQVRRTPDAVAVLDDERRLTYAEFAGAVNRLAQADRRGRRPGADGRTGHEFDATASPSNPPSRSATGRAVASSASTPPAVRLVRRRPTRPSAERGGRVTGVDPALPPPPVQGQPAVLHRRAGRSHRRRGRRELGRRRGRHRAQPRGARLALADDLGVRVSADRPRPHRGTGGHRAPLDPPDPTRKKENPK
jgi:hypothetical protein